MPVYKAPGVYVEERSRFPSAVAAVETAIPAFIGFTERAGDEKGDSLLRIPVRIRSLLEYERYFGRVPSQAFAVNVTQRRATTSGKVVDAIVSFAGTPARIPDYMLYYSMQLFFANGGGACYIVSIGATTGATVYSAALFIDAFALLENFDEPTLYVFPDSCSHRALHVATDADVGDIIDAALNSCAKMRDRFTIADIRNAMPGGNEDNTHVNAAFRAEISSDRNLLKYGAAYFPYLETSLNFLTSDDDVEISACNVIEIADDGTASPGASPIAAHTAISNSTVVNDQAELYTAVKNFIRLNALVTLPPSGAIAGIYARVDASRGVWKAPANESINLISRPTLKITNALNDKLNVDATSGKSVNAIRAFAGKGTLVWGARTLAGNDNEWRYVPVRRFINHVEESVSKASAAFVFEPNDANTWSRVRAMIENFLLLKWREGALTGAKPEQAFYVRVGLNETMSANDVLNGYMIVEIGMAVVRPAEFIVVRFSHNMQKS